MKTPILLSSGDSDRKYLEIINLTNSVLESKERLEKDLMTGLDAFVVGQEEAKREIVSVLIDGLFNEFRDQGSLGAVMLAGPTGVGKTELARALASVLFGNPDRMTKIPAETMSHDGDIARLVGSPAGYVGYGDTPGMADTLVHRGFTEAKEKGTLHPTVKNLYNANNLSIVLVDELEKAPRSIATAFLGAIQSGEMTMAAGKETDTKLKYSKVTDLSNTLFIFTSNVGEHKIASSKRSEIGFGAGGGQRYHKRFRQGNIHTGAQKRVCSRIHWTNG